MAAVLRSLREYLYARSADEALELLGRWNGKARLIAGGTWMIEERGADLEAVVDVSRAGLDYIRDDPEGIHIGGATTIQDLRVSRELRQFGSGVVAQAATLFSPATVRNVATVAGNIVPVFPLADLPPALLALDAQVKIRGREGEISLPLERFLESQRWLTVGRVEVLTEVLLPAAARGWRADLRRFSRSAQDYAMVLVCCALELPPGGRCAQARIAVGAATRRALRFQRAEAMLAGREISESDLSRAAESVGADVQPMPEYRSSPEYRKEICRVLVRRSLTAAWKGAR